MRLEDKDRSDPGAIGRLYVRTRSGDVVELRNLVSVEQGAAPSAITRSGRQRSVTVAANLSGGLVLGDAIEAARAIAKPRASRGRDAHALGPGGARCRRA